MIGLVIVALLLVATLVWLMLWFFCLGEREL
jgi:hypothetical protein